MQGPFHFRSGKNFLLLLLLAIGCARWRPTPVPIRTVSYPGAGQPRTLVVLLPGRRDSPEDFGRFDFPELAARAGAHVDMVAVDAYLGYYFKRMIVERLQEDVIAPARKRYDRIWLVGVSIGGTGSILYSAEHPENVDGILLLAPYLGDETVIGEVAAAGGLRGWKPPEALAPDDFQRRMWAWLKKAGSQGRIPLYLGYGRSDSFARANGLLGEALPPERVFTAPGGHDWKAWRALWEAFLKTGALDSRKIRPAPGGAGRPG
ncbi:MAG TPA: alpha/beta hydrolase [Thermoanaerobaculia bacterium]|jgi:pimeloyl-ACP methyl ester carboxylesterase|nr:alpha/beta hydrolase [Thermoanaerobaculia bacterium]